MLHSEIKDRLIIALDVPDFVSAKNLVDKIEDEGVFYKIGLELMMSGDYFKIIEWLKERNKKVFADLKLYDISETVGRAVKNLAQYEIDLLTIHASSRQIMEQAAQNKGKMQIAAVTVLTNLDQSDLKEMGFDDKISLSDLVVKKAELAINCGIDGVVASSLESRMLREKLGQDFIIVTPGIRLDKIVNDDQKRVADVKEAIGQGSSYLVVGRPITRDESPKEMAAKFNQMIDSVL
ncbi:MAG: orotidine-5'-phosphate decarboxylase [Pelagibacterales bacterium]|nr:orotidine-5'-phosphate decarboxylase [Pelagibacterales bacterium]